MIRWSLSFLCIAFISAILGYGFITGAAAEIAKISFLVIILALLLIHFRDGNLKI